MNSMSSFKYMKFDKKSHLDLQQSLKEKIEESRILEMDINNLKTDIDMIKHYLNFEKNVIEVLCRNFETLHKQYEALIFEEKKREFIELKIKNRQLELLKEKEKLESELILSKCMICDDTEKLKVLKVKLMIQRNMKKARLLKIQKNCMILETDVNQAKEKLNNISKT